MNTLGIDIGGTNTKIGLIDKMGHVISSHVFPTESNQGLDHFFNQLKNNVNDLNGEFDKVGIGAPNVNPLTGEMKSLVNLAWPDFNLLNTAQNIFPDTKVTVDNDANAAAVGELVWGGGKGIQNFIVITLGTGLGSGILIINKIYHGTSGLAGELGHIHIGNEKRVCGCGQLDHLECYVSVRGLKETCKKRTQKDLSFSEIKKLFYSENKEVVASIKFTANILAIGLSQTQSLLLPDKIILTGGLSSLGGRFLEFVKTNFESLSFPILKGKHKLSSQESLFPMDPYLGLQL